MKILITGAHFTPAQAVIEEFKKDPQIGLVYLGRKSTREGDKTLSAESQILPSLGVKFIPIVAGRVQRSFTPYTIPSLFKIPVGFLQSFYILLKEKPDVVLSFGGYVAVPVVFAAWLLSIPVIIHEQTLVSGLANRVSALFADKIAITFKESQFRGRKVILTGNPLRKELLNDDEKRVGIDIKNISALAQKQGLPLILIVGGNQGSHTINESVKASLNDLMKIGCVVHQTGDSKFQDFEGLKELGNDLPNPERYLAKKWIDGYEMGWLFRRSTMVVCRAGMNTLLEGCYFAKPMLVIPLPVKEQIINAEYFKKLGNALVLRQGGFNRKSLLQVIREGLKRGEEMKRKAQIAKEIVIPDAAKRLALETLTLVKR